MAVKAQKMQGMDALYPVNASPKEKAVATWAKGVAATNKVVAPKKTTTVKFSPVKYNNAKKKVFGL